MTLDEIVKSIADTVKESVTSAIGGVYEKYDARFSYIEEKIKSIPSPEKGDKGDSVTVDDVKPIIQDAIKEAISSIEIKEPDISHLEEAIKVAIEGIPEVKDGQDGKDGDDGLPGKDGQDGKDGISPSADDVAKSMEHIFAKWALDFERKADGVLEKAIDRMPKAKDGRDAIDIDGFDLSLGDDDRTVTVSLKRGETVIEKSIKIPSLIDRGVYSDLYTYEKGDGVSYAGSFWIVQKDGPEGKPGSSDDFRLAVKRGRDGKEVVKLDKPETVKVGQ